MANCPTIPLKLFVDKERNRVVLAEENGEFVDTLFSFLTLPLGTIIRLVSHEAAKIGSIKNLYKSVESLDTQVFMNQICKKMLLFPRSSCEGLCQKLKFNLDDTEPTKYFMCSSDSCSYNSFTWLLSTFAGASCNCGKLMDKEMKVQEDSQQVPQRNGVFVQWETMYLIFDDLKVIHNSPGHSLKQLLLLGYKDLNNLTQISSNLGLNQILELLNRALISKSPLSDVFLALGDDESKPMCSFSPKTTVAKNVPTNCHTFGLKITMNKSKNEILYAEADANFVDFLFSFLTTPIGSIIKILDGNLSLGCLDNLCKSFESLNKSSLSCSGLSCSSLLKVAPQFGCMKQPLNIQEKNQIPLFDPRSPNGKRKSALGFVKRPSFFVVMDDLQVASCSSTSSILVLQKLNVPLEDLVEHKVCIGETEALNLLGASLTSKAAFSNALLHIFKKPKQEPTT